MSHAYTLKGKKVWNEKYVKNKLILKGTRMETQKMFERKEKFKSSKL